MTSSRNQQDKINNRPVQPICFGCHQRPWRKRFELCMDQGIPLFLPIRGSAVMVEIIIPLRNFGHDFCLNGFCPSEVQVQ